MAQGVPEGLSVAAANPATSPEDLRMIAYQYPSLRAVVAANPSTYQELLDWLGQLGDADVDLALLKRHERHNTVRTSVFPPTTQPVSYAPRATTSSAARPQQSSGFVRLSQFQETSTPVRPVSATPVQNQRPIVIISVLLALILVLGVIAWFVINDANGPRPVAQSNNTVTSAPADTSAATPTPDSDTASPTPTPSASQEVRFPAPAGAVNTSAVQSPTGNIRCSLQGETVMCSLAQHDFSAGGFADCGADVATTIGAGQTGADLRCDQGLLAGGTVLQYGQTAVFGDVACSSFDNGMSCWNTVTGQGFALNKAGWKAGTNGAIAPNDYGF